MAHQPRNYDTLREDHQKALEALNNHIENPSRPTGHYGDRPQWTDRGDMASQQKSALDMVKAHNDQREGQTAAKEALDKHIDDPGKTPPGVNPPDTGRKPDDIER